MPLRGDTRQGSERQASYSLPSSGLGRVSNEESNCTYPERKLTKWVWLAHHWLSSLFSAAAGVRPALWWEPLPEQWGGWPPRPSSKRTCRTSSACRPHGPGPCPGPWSQSPPAGRRKNCVGHLVDEESGQTNAAVNRRRTCTVALGIHASAMKTFSRTLKPAHSTQT